MASRNHEREKVKRRKGVLSDHKRVGKKLLPPFVSTLGPLTGVSWVRTVMPELLWIALLQRSAGVRRGAELSLTLSRAASEACRKKREWFGKISDFARLTADEGRDVRWKLFEGHALESIQIALRPLLRLYPECPVGFLAEQGPTDEDPDRSLIERVKGLLGALYDKTEPEAIFVQATFLYLAFVGGKLRVAKGLALAEFPRVEEYPRTEMSRRVAAAIRSAVPMLFVGPSRETPVTWSAYFWNRGLELEECSFRKEV